VIFLVVGSYWMLVMARIEGLAKLTSTTYDQITRSAKSLSLRSQCWTSSLVNTGAISNLAR
jgi:hypothetical protein